MNDGQRSQNGRMDYIPGYSVQGMVRSPYILIARSALNERISFLGIILSNSVKCEYTK